MGCNGSKATKNVAEPAKTGDAEPAKTLLAAETGDGKTAEVECKSCGNKGKDLMGKRCTCPIGQALIGPALPCKVTVVSARGLRNADCALAGKSDPYCSCEIAGKPDSKIDTPVVADKLNPEWNYEADIVYCVGNAITFTVKDQDPVKADDFLGKVTLTTAQVFPNGFEGEVPLTEAGDGVEAFLKVKVALVHPKVRVTVVSAKGLRNADWVGKSDAYCVCEIAGKPDSKLETAVVNDSLSPEWNLEAEVVGFQIEDALTFTIKDKDPLKPDDIIGKVSLPCESFLEAGFEGDLLLVDNANSSESFLTVKVQLGEKVEQVVDLAPAPVEEPVPDAASPLASPVGITEEKNANQGTSCWC